MTERKTLIKGYRWEAVVAILAVLFGAGSFAGVKLITVEDMKKEIMDSVTTHEAKQEVKIEGNTEKIEQHDIILTNVSTTMGAIQEVQHKQYAQEEARRITGKIKKRKDREENYDRLRELNLKRLKKGNDVCLTLECN